jgi:peptidoglycan/LPS O-acetylase OafA/YrhL
MELVWPLALAGAFSIFAYTAEQSIKEIPVSRPMPRSLRALVAGCAAVIIGLVLEGFDPPRPWRYSLMFCMFLCGMMIAEYGWALRHRSGRRAAGDARR